MPEDNADEIFIEIEGVKYKADPENPEEALKGEDDQPIPFEEEEKETEEEKTAREKKEKEDKNKEDNEEPKVRKSAKDFIIKRKDKKIKKLEGKKEEDNEFSAEGNEAINKKIQEGIKPILDQVRGNSDEQELKTVLDKYGDSAKDIEKKIRKYMTHPAYKDVPIEFIFLSLTKKSIDKADELKKRREAADVEAEENTTGGSTKRPKKLPKIPDVTSMGDKAFGELLHKVRTGQFK